VGILDAPPSLIPLLSHHGLQLIADARCNPGNVVPVSAGGNQGSSLSTRMSVIPAVSTSHVVLGFGNFTGANSLGEWWGESAVWVYAALEYLSGSGVTSETGGRVTVTFKGRRGAQMEPGSLLFSDPVPFDAVAGTRFFVRVNMQNAGTNLLFPTGYNIQGGTGPGGVNNGEASSTLAAVEKGTIGSGSVSQNRPGYVAILGYTSRYVATAGILGDSIAAGSGDSGFGLNDGGFLVRALGGQLSRAFTDGVTPVVPYTRCARSGETLHSFLNQGSTSTAGVVTSSPLRLAIASLATTVICEYGTNDLGNGTLEALQADVIQLANSVLRRGKRFVQCTVLPKTTSTDGFFTTTNQTQTAYEANRVAFNLWVRSGAMAAATILPGKVGYWDTASAVEVNAAGTLTTDGGYWLRSETPELTGTFTAGSTTTVLNDTSKAWTQDQWRGWMIRVTSGTGSGQATTIQSNTPTAINIGTGWSNAPANGDGYQIYKGYTGDGTHPSTDGAIEIAESYPVGLVR
jgi:lysophospholipase L1-like esterase